MLRKTAATAVSLTLLFAAARAQTAPDAGPIRLASAAPKESIAYFELRNPADLWKVFTSSGLWDRVKSSESYRQAMAADGVKIAAGVAALRAAAGMELDQAGDACFGGGVALAVVPPPAGSKKKPSALLIARAKDPEALHSVRDAFAQLASLRTEEAWVRKEVKTSMRGDVELVTVKNDVSHALVGDWLLASNDLSVLEHAVDRVVKKADDALIGIASFAQAAASAPADAALRGFAWVDGSAALAALKPGARAEDDRAEPAAAFLFDGLRQSILSSPWIASWLTADAASLQWTVRVPSRPAKAAAAFLPEASAPDALAVPHQIGTLILRRDASAFWDHHEEVLKEESEPELEKFNSGLAIIFGVKRIDEELLPKLDATAQIVAARQSYSDYVHPPKVKIPAFALVLHTRDRSKKFLDKFPRAFQTAVTLISADRAQKGLSTLGLADTTVGGTKILYASFPDPDEGAETTIEYNYKPAMFTRGTSIVFCSTLELARDLAQVVPEDARIPADRVREAGKELAPLASGPVDSLELLGPESLKALEENLNTIIATQVVEKGKPKVQAQREFTTIVDILSLFSGLNAETRALPSGMEISVRLRTNGTVAGTTTPAGEPRRVSR